MWLFYSKTVSQCLCVQVFLASTKKIIFFLVFFFIFISFFLNSNQTERLKLGYLKTIRALRLKIIIRRRSTANIHYCLTNMKRKEEKKKQIKISKKIPSNKNLWIAVAVAHYTYLFKDMYINRLIFLLTLLFYCFKTRHREEKKQIKQTSSLSFSLFFFFLLLMKK